jgi:hypothetical protein
MERVYHDLLRQALNQCATSHQGDAVVARFVDLVLRHELAEERQRCQASKEVKP